VTSARPSPARLVWVDTVRGACVLAVVLFHVTAWYVLNMDLPLAADRVWSVVNSYLGSLRMPLLLAVSGLLASRRVLAGWRSPSAAERVAASYYLYAVWLAVYAVVYALLDKPRLPHHIDGPGDAFFQLVWPQTPLWYVFALAVYVLVLTTLRPLPPVVVLGGLAALSVVCRVTDLQLGSAEKIPELAVFFAAGVYGRDLLRRFAQDLGWRRVAGSVAFAAVTVAAGPVLDQPVVRDLLFLARGVAFLLLGVAVVVLAIRWQPVARWGSSLGQQTLPVYVLHVPLLLAGIALIGTDAPSAVLRSPAVALATPLVLTAVLVVLTLLLHRLLLLLRAEALFGMPASWTAAVTRVHAGGRARVLPWGRPRRSDAAG
jgi:surface polysaccharide O-acyltransferase-like enzyme